MFDSRERDLLARAAIACLGTSGPAGWPHLVPVCFALAGDEVVIAVDEKPKRPGELARLANIRRDRRVTLLADQWDGSDWSRLAWVRVEGHARVFDRGDEWPAALGALRARYPQYGAMRLEASPLIAIAPVRVVSWWATPAAR